MLPTLYGKNLFRLPCPVWQAANGLHKVFYFMEMLA